MEQAKRSTEHIKHSKERPHSLKSSIEYFKYSKNISNLYAFDHLRLAFYYQIFVILR
jgi:hypothetical protein